jgi:hypothetical protein
MTDEPSSDPSPEPPPESGRPIALGGPIASGNEQPASGAPEPEPERVPPPAPPPAQRSVVMPILGLLGFVILAAAIGYLWVRPVRLPPTPPDESGTVTALQSDVATLKTQLAALDTRETSDVAALHAAIAALPAPPETSASTPSVQAATPAPSPPPSISAPPSAVAQGAPDTGLAQTVSELSDRLNRLQAARSQQAQSLASAGDLSKLDGRVDDIAQRESKDNNAIRQDLSLVQQQLAILSTQAQTLTKSSAALPQLTAQADRLSQIVRAQEALRAGLPLGMIANASPALTRFANTAPPTEAALRLSFTDAARAADKAGEPTPDQGRFWHRVWLRVQNLVIVRQGDRVILGDPTSAILAHAQTVLDAGDLPGTLAVLATLSGPAAAAMAPWEDQARALLQAREALTQMAAG